MPTLSNYIEAFQSLHTAKVKGVKAPHKAVLLLAVIDLVEEKMIGTPRIRLTDALNNRFNEIWMRYIGHSAIFTADICKPFYHMQHEPFWNLVEKQSTMMTAEPVVPSRERKDLPKGGYTIKAMREGYEYAEIDEALFALLQNADNRALLRVLLINTYLTNQPTKTMLRISALTSVILTTMMAVA